MMKHHRTRVTHNERLKEFLKATIHNSIFICVCCQLRCFKSNVVLFSEKLKEIITSKNTEILDVCIGQKREIAKFHTENIHQKWKNKYEDDIENNNSEYICNNCVKYLKRNKMPPMHNGKVRGQIWTFLKLKLELR